MNPKPKILILDIETTPIVAYVWGLRDQNISLNQIKDDSAVMAWAAKWLGDPASTTIYKDQRKAKDVKNDKAILLPLWKLLNEAEFVVTQNGKLFDTPRLNARFIFHGMTPPNAYRHLDTYQIVRRVADFTSNKLEYLTDKLCTKYKKLSHSEFPGMSLWVQCLAGNKKAWDAMKKYNIHDVLSTEELYLKIRAWAPPTMAKVFVGGNNLICGTCGAKGQMLRQGSRITRTSRIARYQCKKCGAWQQGEKIAEAA